MTMRRILHRSAALCAIALGLVLTGCGERRPGPYSADATRTRDIQEGERLFRKAVAVIDSDAAEAERLLHQALDADLYHGPAHNDLGVLYLRQGKLYDAAAEFEWAGRLLPGMPQPRVNLALTLSKGGKTDAALDACALALEIQPGYLPAHQTAALLKVREGRLDDALLAHLDAIIARANDERWSDWAMRQRVRVEAGKAGERAAP